MNKKNIIYVPAVRLHNYVFAEMVTFDVFLNGFIGIFHVTYFIYEHIRTLTNFSYDA